MSGAPPFGGGGGGFGYPRMSSTSDRRKVASKLPDVSASASSSQEEPPDASAASSSLALAAREEAKDIAECNKLNRWGQMTNTIAAYRRIEQIGEGTYGQVYRAQCLTSGQEVALKKIRVTHPGYYGMPPTIIREIKILKALHHRNMVEMVEVVSSKGVEDLDEDDEREDDARRRAKRSKAAADRELSKLAKDGAGGGGGTGGGDGSASRSPADGAAGNKKVKKSSSSGGMIKTTKSASASAANANKNNPSSSKKDRIVDAREGYKGNLFIVLEYVSHDLTGLLDMQVKFTEVQIKTIFRQLLDVLDYMHSAKYVHRDIKSSNILIDSHFRVKLADFGLARCIAPPVWDQPSDE